MLEVKQLTRCYGNFTAVDHVSFQIQKGEIVGLLGHNGAGKTTIMKMLSGYLEPSSGSITVDGWDIAKFPLVMQEALGYLPENLPIYPEMRVVDFLDYTAILKGLKTSERDDAIRFAIEVTDLADKVLQPISTLSRGYKQRVGVAQAIIPRPHILILDEPTNGLDPTQTQHMRRLIRRLAQTSTVILSTHIMQEVDAICDRALILRDGRLVMDERLEDIYRSNRLVLVTDTETLVLRSEDIPGLMHSSKAPLKSGDTRHHTYILTIGDAVQADEVAASVVRNMVENGYAVYSLSPEKRDLETIYREVNEVEMSSVA